MQTNIIIPVGLEPTATGKTKSIFVAGRGNLSLALIVSKDDITAGDGLRRAIMSGKGKVATDTTCSVFRLLERNHIHTHFIDQEQANSFLAHPCKMIPIECVARRIAFGSYLKRNPTAEKGGRFDQPVTECFLKDDERHDPLIWLNDKEEAFAGEFSLHNPGKPTSEESFLEKRSFDNHSIANLTTGTLMHRDISTMHRITSEVFLVLEDAFAKQNVTLVDLKIEFGFDPYGRLVVADVIDNDSWRIWPGGDEKQMLDKQVFRDNVDPTTEDLKRILGNYRKVAEITSRF